MAGIPFIIGEIYPQEGIIMRKSIIELTLFQALFIGAWLFTRTAPWFFAALGVIVLTGIGMAVYLLFIWKRLPVAERREGVFAVIGWMLITWLVVRANGLTVGSLIDRNLLFSPSQYITG